MSGGILTWVRTIGFVEGLSAAALFLVAMPMKYRFESISKENFFTVGMTHGVLWILYALVATVALLMNRLSFKTWFLLGLCSLLPFGPIVADRWLLARRRESAIVESSTAKAES